MRTMSKPWFLYKHFLLVIVVKMGFITMLKRSVANSYSLPISEYNALNDLYKSTYGIQWTWSKPYAEYGYPWIFETPQQNPCSSTQPWQGITCNNNCEKQQCYVLSIDLYDHSLRGNIPNSISSFSQLTYLDFSENKLTSTIPSSLSDLSMLTYLYMHNNELTGTIPLFLSNFSMLQQLFINNNHFTGTIPASLGNLKTLKYLNLNVNQLTGTIPSSLEKLNLLEYLYLNVNHLSGTIPSGLGSLRMLTNMYLYANMLTGTVPSSFGNLTMLQGLFLDTNLLSGSFPSTFRQLRMLVEFNVYFNQLTGTIPSFVGNWGMLEFLYIEKNFLTGTMPSELGNLMFLQAMHLYENQLTGTIPSALGNLSSIVELTLYENAFTGTIPSSLGSLRTLQHLNLFGNQLTGTIPSVLGNLSSLAGLYLYENQLTGTLPASFGRLSNLTGLYLFENKLTGTIPWKWKMMYAMEGFLLNNNLLSGSIPPWLLNIPVMFYLDLSNNQLTGALSNVTVKEFHLRQLVLSYNYLTATIPASVVQNGRRLSLFYVNNNQLTGIIPSMLFTEPPPVLTQFYGQSNYLSGNLAYSFSMQQLRTLYLYNNVLWGSLFTSPSQMPSLQTLDVSNNIFSGSICKDWFVNMSSLESISLNNNQLTGPLVDSMFTSSTNLSSVVLASNCFTGTIPSSLCNSQVLAQVIMDGLHSASSCSYSAIPWLPDSGILTNDNVHGTIPNCVFSLPALTTLHLGGNALTGTIPNVKLSDSLTTLTLSSNQLTGMVPHHIWNSNITSLDLSFNHFQGILASTILPVIAGEVSQNATVKLNNNQFSGLVPSVLLQLVNVDILEGNMFSCNLERTNIPSHDPKYNSFKCGSDFTNISLVGFGISTTVVVVIACISWLFLRRNVLMVSQLGLWFLDAMKTVSLTSRMTQYCVVVTVVCSLVGLLIYGILSKYYSTYTDSYVWKVSAIYKSGIISSILILVWLLGILGVAQHQLTKWAELKSIGAISAIDNNSRKDNSTHLPCKYDIVTIVIIVSNLLTMTTINGLYVYAVRSNIATNQLVACALALSLIKILINHISVRLGPLVGNNALIGICLFNNLVAPFLAELFVSSDCFLYVVSKQSSLNFVFDVYSCPIITFNTFEIPCSYNLAVKEGFSTTTSLIISPPFHYSNQCSFSLISSYVYIFVFRYIISGIVSPCVNWCFRHLVYSKDTRRSTIDNLLPTLWRNWDVITVENDLNEKQLDALHQYVHKYLAPQFVVTMVTDLSILICFGVLFPPLTLVIMVSILKDIFVIRWTNDRLNCLKERFNDNEIMTQKIIDLIELIQAKYNDATVDIKNGSQWGLCITGVIWAFVLFDILASAEGAIQSIWIAVLMVTAPWMLWAVHINRRFVSCCKINNHVDTDDIENEVIQKHDVTNPVIFGTDNSKEVVIKDKIRTKGSIYSIEDEL